MAYLEFVLAFSLLFKNSWFDYDTSFCQSINLFEFLEIKYCWEFLVLASYYDEQGWNLSFSTLSLVWFGFAYEEDIPLP